MGQRPEVEYLRFKMSERHRALPPWMANKDVKGKEKAPLRSQRKRKAARAVFYCMNEAELVEAAASHLTNGACEEVLPVDRQDEKAAKKSTENEKPATSQRTSRQMTEILEEESSDCCDDLETTYVSETDVDITEVETLPFTKSPHHAGCEGEKSVQAQNDCGLKNVEVESEQIKVQVLRPAAARAEDDALQLVREIFFT